MSLPTKFYKLWFSETAADPMVCDKYDLKGFPKYALFSETPILDWPRDPPTFWGDNGEAEDYLTATVNGWALFSERTCAIFEEYGVRGIDFHPVKVLSKATGEEILGYKVAHIWLLVEALDREHSNWDEDPENPGTVIGVFKAVLKADAVKDLDVFRLAENYVAVYFSERIVKAINSQKLTGFKFFPTKAM